MDRFQRLSNLWNWLPVFRAVAEVENLPAASRKLNISASSLSRTVRLLEDEIGHPLFDRVGRRLVLNHRGSLLLAGVRDSMRRVSDAVDQVTTTMMSGPVRIASPGSFMPILVLPALRQLKRDYPELCPVLESVNPDEIPDRLVTGRLDLVLTDQSVTLEDELIADLLFEVGYGVYCGAGHPLYDQDDSEIDLTTICQHEFAAPPEHADHWPVHIDRRIGIFAMILSTGVELCACGDFLAVLPDVVARSAKQDAPLRRLPFDPCAPVPMYAIYRRDVTTPSSTAPDSRRSDAATSPTAAVLQAIRQRLSGNHDHS